MVFLLFPKMVQRNLCRSIGEYMYPTISFIIPTYNRAHTLPEAIRSVLEQSCSNWELLIIDDGSSDNTREIISEYLTDNRVRYYYQENQGVSNARNKGIRESKGDYLIFLDSDDRVLPGLILKLNNIDLPKYDLVFWQVKKIFPDHTEIWKPRKLEKIYKNIKATFLSGSVCYNKSIVVKLGGFDEELQFSENYELGLRVAQCEEIKFKSLEEIFLIYNVTPFIDRDIYLRKLKSVKHLLEKHTQLYLEDTFSYSRLLHQMGYLYEKTGKKDDAELCYKKSWKTKPVYLKPLLRFLYLKGKNMLVVIPG